MPASIVFLLSAAFLFYVLFGYPLLLSQIARRRRSPRALRNMEPRSVSILLPVYNGARWLRAKLESLLALDYPHDMVEILVVSDGSTDATCSIAREFAGPRVRLLTIPHGGKAMALNAGLAEARGEILLFTDVRQQLDPGALRHLVAHFADPQTGAVSGELVIRDGMSQEEYDIGLYWRYEKWIRKHLSTIDSVIGATGALYAMRRHLARPLPPETLLDDVQLPLYAFFAGYRILFEEQARAFDESTSLHTEFRRKVRTLAGNYQLIARFPALLHPLQNRMWIHFVSHKLGRLLLPFALAAMALATFSLPFPWRPLAGGSQAALYASALLDLWVPESSFLKRFTSPARTFVVLMAATLCAPAILFIPASRLWTTSRGTQG